MDCYRNTGGIGPVIYYCSANGIDGDTLLRPPSSSWKNLLRENIMEPSKLWIRIPIKDKFGSFDSYDAAQRVESALSNS